MRTRPMNLLRVLGCASLILAGACAHGDPEQITLAGSSTVTRVLLPLKAGVEADHHVAIRLLPAGSGRGLIELAAGRADAAMLSGPLDYLLARAEAVAPTGLHLDQLERLKLADSPKAEIVALVQRDNPVRRLTAVQLQAILTGEIANWRELGGPDRAIRLVLTDELDGVRATLATGLLAGRPCAAGATVVERTPEVPARVAADPGAIGLVPRSMLSPEATYAEVEPKIPVALFLVARKDRIEADPRLELVLNALHSRAR